MGLLGFKNDQVQRVKLCAYPEVHQGLGRQMGKEMEGQKHQHWKITELSLEERDTELSFSLLLQISLDL